MKKKPKPMPRPEHELVKELFPKIFVTCFSFTNSTEKHNLYKALSIEQGFAGLVTDATTILEYKFSDPQTFCAVNFPYFGCSDDIIINFVANSSISQIDDLGGYILSVNKYDVQELRWNNIRKFLKSLDEVCKKTTYISLDVSWLENEQKLSTFFSLIEPYDNFLPVISCFSKAKQVKPADVENWAKKAKNSSIKPVCFFGPPPLNLKYLDVIIKKGFSQIGIPAKLAVDFITSS